MPDELDFYRTQSPLSRFPDDVDLSSLPAGIEAQRRLVQWLLVHWGWGPAYGIPADQLRKHEQNLRSIREVVTRAVEQTGTPITQMRQPLDRVVGICRHFALLHVALLRETGTPARMRCGFANYFEPGKWVDHWITERWDGDRWVRDDPQVDGLQASFIKPSFDVNDQPPGHFLTGAQAWIATRAGELDPQVFGIFDMWGQSFIGGNVLLDLGCLNKVELLPWDAPWNVLTGPFDPVPDDALPLLDDVAKLVQTGDVVAIRDRYETDNRLKVPNKFTTFLDGLPTPAELPT